MVVRMRRLDIVGQGKNRLGVPVTLPLDPHEHQLTRGGSCLLTVDVQIEKSTCSVRIELSSEEVEGGRVWPWRQEVEFPAPPATAMMSTAAQDVARSRHEPGF